MTEYNKLIRLHCIKYKDADFNKYVLVDETAVRLWDLPFYHWQLAKKYPEALLGMGKHRKKVNVWGRISFKGRTPFAVKKLNKTAINFFIPFFK